MDGIVTIAVFHIATHRMPHIGRMNTNLVLPARLQFVFHQRMLSSTGDCMEVCHSIFATIVHRRRIGKVCFIVLQPTGNGAIIFLHLSADHSHISTIIHYLVPLMLQDLLCLNVLGIYHQSTGITVETMNHMCMTLLTGCMKIFIKYRLYVQGLMPCCHRQDANILFYHHQVLVLVHYLYITALELVVLFGLADSNLHARL